MKTDLKHKILKFSSVVSLLVISTVFIIGSFGIMKAMFPTPPDYDDTQTSFSFSDPTTYTISDITSAEVTDNALQLIAVDQTDDDDTASGFGGAIQTATVWAGSGLSLQTGLSTGTYTSREFNVRSTSSWETFSWIPAAPYTKEYPDNASTETAYSTGNVAMTNNVMLLHLDETSGSVTDYSGSSNNAVTPTAPTQGQVLYWSFDTYTLISNTVADLSGNENDGTIQGTVTSGTGKVAEGLYLDGATNDINSDQPLTSNSDFTISVWYYPTRNNVNNDIIYSSTNIQLYFDQTTNYLTTSITGNQTATSFQLSDTSTYQWHHIVWTNTNGGNQKVYVNNTEVLDTSSFSFAISASTAYLGALQAGTDYLQGYLDEVRIYSSALSASDISDIYYAAKSVAEYTTPTYSATGKYNTALSFAGQDDFIAASHSTTNNLTDELTLEAWIKRETTGWNYKMPITISPATSVSEYQLKVELTTSTFDYSKANSDGSDLRFLDANGKNLSYYIESWNDTGTSTIWVKITSPGTSTIYMYYGNSLAAAASSSTDTFIFCDDMETWTGWSDRGNGVVAQDSTRAYTGTYSAHKDTYNDPNGGYKNMGTTLTGTDFVLDCWVNRNSTYPPGGSVDRIGVTNSTGDGYGMTSNHNLAAPSSTYVGIDTRTGFVAAYSPQGLYPSVEDQWVHFTMIFETDGITNTITAQRYVNGILNGEKQITDTSYHSFTHAYILGGNDYWVDNLYIRKYDSGEPASTLGSELAIQITKGTSYGIGTDGDNAYGIINNQSVSGSITSGWNHIVLTYDPDAASNQQKLYINGTLTSQATQTAAVNMTYDPIIIGNAYEFNGTIDELALYSRALTQTEITNRYNRGMLNIRFQVRSSATSPATGDFTGPDGTTATYYSELINTTTGLPALTLSGVTDNPVFQYMMYLDSEIPGTSPVVSSVTIGPEHLPTSVTEITTTALTGFSTMSQFAESVGPANQGTILYQFSLNGTDWYYHDGSSWVLATSQSQGNTAAEINTYAATFTTEVGSGSLYVKVLISSDGTQQIDYNGFTFDGTPYGYFTWYLAEGTTRYPFDTWITILNPNDIAAQTKITYSLSNGDPVTKTITIPAHQRYTDYVNDSVTNDDVATFVESLNYVGLIVEGIVYWNTTGESEPNGGHCSLGTTQPATTWYLAEGSTQGNLDTYITLGNPNDEDTEATLKFTKMDGNWIQHTVTIPAQQRETVHANEISELVNQDFSTIVTATLPIVVERVMYFSTASDHWIGGHRSLAAKEPATTWYFAEGATTDNYDFYILLLNTSASSAEVDCTFFTDTGQVVEKDYTIDPYQRETIHVNTIPLLENAGIATIIESTNGALLVAERSMYWKPNQELGTEYYNDDWIGGSCTIGSTAPATVWYLAEGSTETKFSQWILIANPSEEAATVTVSYMKEDGVVLQNSITVNAKTRYPIHADEDVINAPFAALIESTNSVPIVVERSMYWDKRDSQYKGGHSSIGSR